MLKAEIIKKLKKAKVDFDPKATKADLESKLELLDKAAEGVQENIEVVARTKGKFWQKLGKRFAKRKIK